MKIKKGDKFKVGEYFKSHLFQDRIMTVKKVENLNSLDGFIYFDLDKGVGNRNKKYNHQARVWFFKEYCEKLKGVLK